MGPVGDTEVPVGVGVPWGLAGAGRDEGTTFLGWSQGWGSCWGHTGTVVSLAPPRSLGCLSRQ